MACMAALAGASVAIGAHGAAGTSSPAVPALCSSSSSSAPLLLRRSFSGAAVRLSVRRAGFISFSLSLQRAVNLKRKCSWGASRCSIGYFWSVPWVSNVCYIRSPGYCDFFPSRALTSKLCRTFFWTLFSFTFASGQCWHIFRSFANIRAVDILYLSPYGCTSFRIFVLYGWSCIKCMVRGVASWMPMDFATYWLQQNQEDSLLSRSGLYRQTTPHQTLPNKLRNCMEIWRLRSVFGVCFLCEG